MLPQLPDLLNFDLWVGCLAVRLDYPEVRVGVSQDLETGAADPTGVRALRSVWCVAVDGLREAKGDETFPDAFGSVEQQRMSQTVMYQSRPQNRFGLLVPDDFVEWHRPKSKAASHTDERQPVERQRSYRR